MKMRKTFCLFLSILLLLAIVGCAAESTPPATTSEPVTAPAPNEAAENQEAPAPAPEPTGGITLSILANQDWVTKPYMKAAWDNYQAKTGNILDIQAVPIDTGSDIMQVRFATGEIPDIFMHFGGHGLAPFQPETNFVDFSDAFWVSDIQEYVLAQTKFNNRIYGLPHWEASVSGLMYNREIFDDLGLALPKTHAEFEAVCDALLAAGITPIYLAFSDVWPLLYQFGVDPLVADTTILDRLNSNQMTYADMPGFKDLVTWYRTLVDKGYIGTRFTTNTWDGAPEAMASGEYAMMYAWDSWAYSDIEPSYPGYAAKFGIMPAFMGSEDRGAFPGPNVCLSFVNKNGPNVEAAIEYINFMATPENYNIAFDGFATAPVFFGQTTHVATSAYVGSKDWIAERGFASMAWPFIIGFTQVDAARYLQDLMLGNIDVDEAVRLMDQDRIEIAKTQQTPGF